MRIDTPSTLGQLLSPLLLVCRLLAAPTCPLSLELASDGFEGARVEGARVTVRGFESVDVGGRG